jgi:hypothetical protein
MEAPSECHQKAPANVKFRNVRSISQEVDGAEGESNGVLILGMRWKSILLYRVVRVISIF